MPVTVAPPPFSSYTARWLPVPLSPRLLYPRVPSASCQGVYFFDRKKFGAKAATSYVPVQTWHMVFAFVSSAFGISLISALLYMLFTSTCQYGYQKSILPSAGCLPVDHLPAHCIRGCMRRIHRPRQKILTMNASPLPPPALFVLWPVNRGPVSPRVYRFRQHHPRLLHLHILLRPCAENHPRLLRDTGASDRASALLCCLRPGVSISAHGVGTAACVRPIHHDVCVRLAVLCTSGYLLCPKLCSVVSLPLHTSIPLHSQIAR